MKLILALLILPIFLTGCTTFTITNLTPSTFPRSEEGTYLVEMEITSNQHTLRRGSISPSVMVGFEQIPMHRVPLMTNRFELLLPVAEDQKLVHYRFKVNYEYDKMGGRGHGSRMSTEYIMKIED